MISACLGDAVFPAITIAAITKFGINEYLNFLADKIARAIKEDSSVMA